MNRATQQRFMSGWRAWLYEAMRGSLVYKDLAQISEEIDAGGESSAIDYLARILEHARTNVPYYEKILAPGKDWVKQFQDIPILPKKEIFHILEQLKSRDFAKRHPRTESTGGSTGTPVIFVQDKEYDQWRIASEEFYYREIFGADFINSSKVILWGGTKDISELQNVKSKLGRFLKQLTFLDTNELTPQIIESHIKEMHRKKPVIIRGYAGSLYRIARYAQDHNLTLYQPHRISSSAETLEPFMREVIESEFRCKVYDYYGSREVGIIAAECREGSLHTLPFNNVVEVVDEQNRPVKSGQEGRVLVTTLHNYSMPLIRYEIGDRAIWKGICPCGVPYPALEKVTGRTTDYFVSSAGVKIHGGYFYRLFYHCNWVSEFQILQREEEWVQIYYIRRAEVDLGGQMGIEKQIRLKLGKLCRIEWIETEDIPKTPQGKFLYTRSLVT